MRIVTFEEIKKKTYAMRDNGFLAGATNEELDHLARKRFEGQKYVLEEMKKARDEGRLSPELLKNPEPFDAVFAED